MSNSTNSFFGDMEKAIRQYWDFGNIFQMSIDKKHDSEYVFYDGPPFANGLPHYGHLLTGFVKDLVARYQTMQGNKVGRRFGWDCHGLPAEVGAEKELGIHGVADITKYGIGKFNQYCQGSVLKYAGQWEEYVSKQSRWVDFENDYKTMDLDYMESVIWGFKRLYDKGLMYQGSRIMPYSWKCQTPLSNFEIKLDNSYRQKESKSLFVKFELEDVTPEIAEAYPDVKTFYMVAWTTTPWTLPSNLSLAVHSEIDYTVLISGDEGYIVASELHDKLKEKLKIK